MTGYKIYKLFGLLIQVKFIKHILRLLVLVSIPAMGQTSPDWIVQPTAEVGYVKVPDSISLPGTLAGDIYFGAFYTHTGTLKCGGFSQYEPGIDLVFPIYKNEAGTDGFIEGEQVHIMIFAESLGCQHFYNVAYAGGDNTFWVGDTLEISNLTASAEVNISYSKSNLCQSEGILNPDITIPYFPSGDIEKFFSAASANLIISASKGEIYPAQSQPGTYEIFVESPYCLTNDFFTITIEEFPMDETVTKDAKLCNGLQYQVPQYLNSGDLVLSPLGPSTTFTIDTAGVYYFEMEYLPNGCHGSTAYNISEGGIDASEVTLDIVHKNCLHDGKLSINYPATAADVVISYIYMNGDTTQEMTFDNLAEGPQDLFIADSDGCLLDLTAQAVIEYNEADCNKKDIVFYPDHPQFTNGKIIFEEAGVVTIVSKAGQVIKQLSGPVEWDGTDASGNELPSGLYFIIYENGEVQNLTVVR